ncbi:MAG: ABC transporter ATP-binding protein [candidate division Zixibacteria bacterium]
MAMAGKAISVNELSKCFKGGLKGQEVLALSGVSFDVETGQVFGLLGPNGAGKTTMVKILIGALNLTSGSATVNGLPINNSAARSKIGFLPENHRFPAYLTGIQMLLVFGGMAGLSSNVIKTRSLALLELVGMSRWGNTRIKKYSKGMMQRLGLAQALLNDPDILFLDEPTDGVDPIGRREIRDILREQKAKGKTIFLNSHLLAEVESVCDKVAILDKGKLIAFGPINELIKKRPQYKIETVNLSHDVSETFKTKFPDAHLKENSIIIELEEMRLINSIIDLLRQLEVEIISVTPQKISLEDSFMQLVSREDRHA